MPWARTDDQANGNAKLLALSDGAFRLWSGGKVYCAANLTDGFIPKYVLPTLPVRATNRKQLVDELTTALVEGKKPLWHVVPGGFLMNDYLDWNDSREKILKERANGKARVDKFRQKLNEGAERARNGARNALQNELPTPNERRSLRASTTTTTFTEQRDAADHGGVLPSEPEEQNQRDGARAPARMSLDSNYTRVLKRAMHAILDVFPTLADTALIARIAKQHLPGMKIAIHADDIAPTLQPLVDAVRNKRTPAARREQSVSPLLRDTLTLAGMKTGAAFELFAGCYFVPNDMLQMALVVPDAERKEQIRPFLAELHHAFRKVSKSALRMGAVVVAPRPGQIIEGYRCVMPPDDVVHLCELAGIKTFFIGSIFDGAVLGDGHGADELRLTVRGEAFEFVDRQFGVALVNVAHERLAKTLTIQPAGELAAVSA